MTMPQIPEEKHRPSLEETVIDLLESIALEEIAISHLINAEAEKSQAVICKLFNEENGVYELIKYNKTTSKLIDSLIIKEWLLLKKLETTLEIGVFPPEKQTKYKHEHCQENEKNNYCTCCDVHNDKYIGF